MNRKLSAHHVVQAQDLAGHAHWFFTRQGGVSAAPYDSLNASQTVGDRTYDVGVNRSRVATHLGVRADALVTVTQVHSARVVTLEDASQLWPDAAAPEADAIVSTLRDHAIGVLTADCAPVLFCDESSDIVAAAHAGWRGAACGILEETVAAMRAIGAKEITAIVGPCIGPRHYEVGADMRTQVEAVDTRASVYFHAGNRSGRSYFDLGGYCMHRLRRAGLKRVSRIRLDTLSDPQRFFSHRRTSLAGLGKTGRQISVIRAGARP